jgi:hypothetical protein
MNYVSVYPKGAGKDDAPIDGGTTQDRASALNRRRFTKIPMFLIKYKGVVK